MTRRYLLAVVLASLALPATAQDYEREARWRAQVVPNLVVGDAVDLHAGDGRTFLGLYTAAAAAKTALVIVHGIGVHPDHGVIGSLRMGLADAGFSTLSIQMPVLAAEAPPPSYAALFPLAAQRIGAAASWLKARGYADLVLVSHSMGSRMANAYFDAAVRPAFRAWIALGLGDAFSREFAARKPVPVLDVQGDADLPAVLEHAPARARVAGARPGGRQLTIAGADHFFAGRQAELIEAIAAFARR
jgi:hypothetical protein